jgi:hypothetical protein
VSSYKAGDKVWVLCKVIDTGNDSVRVKGGMGTTWWTYAEHCRPVEPEAKEPTPAQKLAERTMKAIWAANHAVNEPPVKEPDAKKYREPTLVDLKNGPIDCEVRDYHDEPWKSGVLVCVHNSRAWRFQAQPQTRSYVYAPHWNQCRIAVPVEPIPEPVIKESLTTESSPSEIPDSSSEAWAPKVGERVRLIETGDIYEIESYSETYAQYSMRGWPGSCVNLENIEPVNSPKIQDSSSEPLASSPCMDGVDADQFIESIMEARGRTSDPINPSHYKQGGIECIEAMKVALGGGFLGYLRGNAIKYLWRYDKKNGVEDLKKARWYLDRLIKEVGE